MSTLIANRYELKQRLGSGGMSTVQLALDTRLQRDVAVKLLAEHLADDPAFVSRFQREALSAAKLIHPNIVQVFDSGLDEESGRHYIVMELVDGPSCAQLLKEQGQMSIDDVVDIIEQSCRGLNYAHQHGVIHRDVKPGNLLQSPDGVIKLADFGIALAVAAGESRITQIGSVLGTAAYLSPEQSRGEQAGPASDIYALGVVAYQLLAGRLPYEAPSLTELALMREREQPPALETLNAAVPVALAQTIERALALYPEDRFASANEMGDAIKAAAKGVVMADGNETQATKVLGAETAATRAMTRSSAPPAERRQPRQPRQVRSPEAPARSTPGAKPSKKSKKNSGGRRLITVLFLLAVVAATIIIASEAFKGTSNQVVKLRNVVEQNVQDTVGSIKQLIEDNTQ